MVPTPSRRAGAAPSRWPTTTPTCSVPTAGVHAGTGTTLSAVAQGPVRLRRRAPTSRGCRCRSCRDVAANLLSATHEERSADPAIHPGRVDVIAGGALIVQVLAEELHACRIDELVVSEHDILDGIALSLA
ncbi:MAG: hypothetical protein ACRDSL_04625 [Pseudonocardiaceae bacterium]